ncbi:Laccase-1 [Leucoagaricus sp. SymC.cos]|nr:Laccase-1 [Leucoagaricus sp. SymC.cos]
MFPNRYHELAPSIKGIPLADTTLINGKGRFPGGPDAELSVVNIQHGKRYRLRLVSMSCDPNFTFSIDEHDLLVIESDGQATLPHSVNSIQIFAGQRYSVVLIANQPVDNYWIRALPNSGNRNLSTTFENGVNSAILRYGGAPNTEPKSQQINTSLLKEADLHPLLNPAAPGLPTANGADVTFNLDLYFDEKAFRFKINNDSFTPPTVPILLQILSGARNAHDLLPRGGVLTVERNKVVQVNIPSGLTGGPHPFHLHGHSFSVVKSADSQYNFYNPVRRDVVSAGDTQGDFVAIRFRTDNPGPWIFHCHIDFHLNDGLAIVFAEAPGQTSAAVSSRPADWDQLCPTWDALPDSVKATHPY